MPGLAPREYRIEEYTRTVCPQCMAAGSKPAIDEAFIDGMLVSHDGSVWMRRWCPIHGETESLYEQDLELWQLRSGWQTPTLGIVPDRVDNNRGFPAGYRDGLPASHGQHTCILLLNILEHCNLKCPTCYASALDPATALEDPIRPTIDEIEATVDTMIQREAGKLGVVMLSGGEPTLRRDLPEILERLAAKSITRIMINTNGRRIARDDRFMQVLERFRDRIEIYLQFDGFESGTYIELRGEDLAAEKAEAIRRLQQAGIWTTLVATVRRGVNEHEVGEILRYAMDSKRIAGVAFQPAFGSGRTPMYDPLNRSTPTGVLRQIQESTNGAIKANDFIPLPCSHKDCCDIGYFIRGSDEKWRSVVDLVGRDELKRWLHLVSNKISFEDVSSAVQELVKDGVLQRVFSEQQRSSSLALAGDLMRMCGCVPGFSEAIGGIWAKLGGQQRAMEKFAERTLRVTVKMFMDAHTFHEARIRQCCVHVGTFEEDPRRYSFCWRWLFEDASDFPDRKLSEGSKRLEVLPV